MKGWKKSGAWVNSPQADEVAAFYGEGHSVRETAERFGVTLDQVNSGEMCDWNDHSWSKYSGPMYPSIDHIIPMSKGGGHTWDNVQVAHIMCNSLKGVTA